MINQLYLYVALIGVGIVLFALTRPKKSAMPEANVQQQPALDFGLKETLDEFMDELERDNARMVDSFVKLQNDYKQKIASQQQAIQDLQLRVSNLEAKFTQHDVYVSESNLVDEPRPESAAPLGFIFNEKYAKVVDLFRQGLTAEQIARATDMGMGEIQLVIGLAKREDN